MSLFSETLLVTMPTPDFSMPYNVICLGINIIQLLFIFYYFTFCFVINEIHSANFF